MKHLKMKVLLVIVVITVLGFALRVLGSAYIGIKNKEEWSILDAVAGSHRLSTDESTILFTSLNGYEVIGIRAPSEPVQ
jgi:hypothetical protein